MRQAHQRRSGMLALDHALRRLKANIAQPVLTVDMGRVGGAWNERGFAAGKNRRIFAEHIENEAGVGHRLGQAYIAGDDRQCLDLHIGMGAGHHNRMGIVDAGVGINYKAFHKVSLKGRDRVGAGYRLQVAGGTVAGCNLIGALATGT